MTRNRFILDKIKKIREDAAQRRKDKRYQVFFKHKNPSTPITPNRAYTQEEIDRFKTNYQVEVRKEKQKTVLVAAITLFLTPVVCYLIYLFFSVEWSIS